MHVVRYIFHYLFTTVLLKIREIVLLVQACKISELHKNTVLCTESSTANCTQPPHGSIHKICMHHMPPTNPGYPLETS